MITIIFGPPKIGKTARLTDALLREAYNYKRIRQQAERIAMLNAGGFNLKPPKCLIYANYELKFSKFGCPDRSANFIDPFKLGYANDDKIRTYYLPPYSVIGITEGQAYFDAREFQTFKRWKSSYFEQHEHNHLDIYIDAQRADLIDLNIRALAKFIEIVNFDKQTRTWTVREFANLRQFNKYLQNENEGNLYYEHEIKAAANVFKMYDAWECEALHHAGHVGMPFYEKPAEFTQRTKAGFMDYIKKHEIERPKAMKK